MRTRDENKEQAIRQQAIEMIVKYGLEGFSMQKLAKAANVSPATMYIYYQDKEDLVLSLGTEVFNKMQLYSLKNFSSDLSFDEGLKLQWKNRAAFFLENPLDVQFIEHLRYSPAFRTISHTIKNSFKAEMGKFVHNAVLRGELVQLPFEVYWSVAFSPLYQLMKFHTQGESYASSSFELTDEVMDQTLQVVLKALKP
ncbi:TetR/AcrR family transcriptional regulator [Solitalea sp. MAHUQ-68]|uniref:TetR/AcrR family transcriptional regulator n=1 Tax=Solitalea agri TaxID=2953739 RepID=A0A9X2F1S4_9SPHI|nr:TetR/AcrR family transcriptional regulator [Solitalea agri]MCO4292590.1 TetR/AcrR family transcriptional regulator [Solitalea agri]